MPGHGMKFTPEKKAVAWLNETRSIYAGVSTGIRTEEQLREWKKKWKHDMDTPLYRKLMDKRSALVSISDLGTCYFIESLAAKAFSLWLAKGYLKWLWGPTQRVEALHVWIPMRGIVHSFARKMKKHYNEDEEFNMRKVKKHGEEGKLEGRLKNQKQKVKRTRNRSRTARFRDTR